MKKNLTFYARIGLMLLLVCAAAHAQTTFATITGAVSDSSGSAVPNADITATEVNTNVSVTTKSNEVGNYTIAQLKEGTYKVVAQSPGFQEFVAANIVLAARDLRRIDVQFEIGSVKATVEVNAGATLIETETARIGTTRPAEVLNSLPLNSRGLWASMGLAPGLNQQSDGTVRFAGSRANQGNFTLDGTTFADGVDNTATGPLMTYMESVQELHVDLANNSAEFGSLGQVSVVSKSGTNGLHGAAFDYFVTPMFRAADPFTHARATGILHTPGFSVGGPVWVPKIYNGRNRTFFFFSVEPIESSQKTQILNPTVPLPSWRQGDFSNLAASIYDPTSRQPFPGRIIPASRLNPVALAIQNRFYPLPNTGSTTVLQAQNFREAVSRPADPSKFIAGRLDEHVDDKNFFFTRYSWQRNYNRQYDGNLPTIGQRYQVRNDRAATVSYTHLSGTDKVNEIRWGYGFNNNPVAPAVNGPQIVSSLGLVGLAPNLPDIPGLPKINFSGVGLTGITQPNYTNPGYRTHTEEIQERFSWFHGRHNARFGYNALRAEFDEATEDPNLFGNLTFTNRFSSGGVTGQGSPYADFLLGIPSTAARAFPSSAIYRNRWSHDFYAQDDFRLNSRITLNLGLRYELHLPWRENNNRMAAFDIGSGSIVVPDGALSLVSPNMPKNYVPVVEASSAGMSSRSLINPRTHDFAPRLGVAWRPWDNKTVIRAGFGIFYNVVPFIYALSFGGTTQTSSVTTPFVVNEADFTNDANNPQVILPRMFPASGSTGLSTVTLPSAINPNLRTPYSMQYNFTVERQQWDTGFRLSYVGTALREGEYQYNYNAPLPSAQPFAAKARAFPNYPNIPYVTNGAGHQYNALTVEAQRQMARGLYFQSSWTWARDRMDLDYNWDFSAMGVGGPLAYAPENPSDRHREIGPSQEIPKFRFTSNWVYQLPFGRGRQFASHISRLANFAIGGWELTGVYSTQTGQYLTPLWSGSDPVGISYTPNSSPAIVTLRPDILTNPNLPGDQRSINRWFNTGSFTPPQAGQFGTSAKGVIRGPGTNVWDLGIAKEFQFTDRGFRLRWEFTGTNIFNHPNWANPGTTLSSASSFGVVTAVGVNNQSAGDINSVRVMRMGLRLRW